MTIPMTSEQDKVLRLMAEKYPTKEIVYEKIVYLQSQLMLPKGTEHFMSDLHGAYDALSAREGRTADRAGEDLRDLVPAKFGKSARTYEADELEIPRK